MIAIVRRSFATAVASALCCAAWASQASAASSIVSVDVGQAKAEIATTIKVRTISEIANARLYVMYRAVGGPPCAPTPFTDPGRYLADFDGDSVAAGDVTTSQVSTFTGAGTFQFCAWLRDSTTANYIATSTGTFTVASPVGSITGVAAPTPAPRGRAFLVSVSGQTEVSRTLYTHIRPATQPPCAPSPGLDPASATYDLSSQGSVLGLFTKQIQYTLDTPGTYRHCAWVASSTSDLAPLGVNETLITVPAPVVVVAVKPKLASARVTGRRLVTRVRLDAPGRLQVILVGKGRRIGLGSVRVAAARTVTLTYRRPGRVAPGRYVLEVRFRVDKGPLSVVRRAVRLG